MHVAVFKGEVTKSYRHVLRRVAMSFSSRTLWIICLVSIVALSSCDRQGDEERRSFKSLVRAYKKAHTEKDIDALLEMVYVGSGVASEVNLRTFREYFELDLTVGIKHISRKRLEREDLEREKYAILEPLGIMYVEHVNDKDFQYFSSYCFGKSEGVYYIVGTGPGLVEADLRSMIQGTGFSKIFPGVGQHAKPALSNWLNSTVDPEPILFYAILIHPSRSHEVLWLHFIDEDMDVVGFLVEEHYTDANDKIHTLLEEYPVFAHGQWSNVIGSGKIPVSLRDAEQKADMEKWASYVQDAGVDENESRSVKYWEEAMPTVWVSVPEPNKNDVNVYIYDQAGNRSEPVRLLNRIRED